MTVQDIYDFENILPSAVAAALKASNLAALTPSDGPELQKQRPRTEVVFQLGAAIGPLDPATLPDAGPPNAGRNLGWSGTLTVMAISAADAPGKLVHSLYRARVRNACATLMATLNGGTYLQFHKVLRLVERGTVYQISTDKLTEVTTFNFDLAFGIQTGVWVTMTGTN